jgi:hypothetical protein
MFGTARLLKLLSRQIFCQLFVWTSVFSIPSVTFGETSLLHSSIAVALSMLTNTRDGRIETNKTL